MHISNKIDCLCMTSLLTCFLLFAVSAGLLGLSLLGLLLGDRLQEGQDVLPRLPDLVLEHLPPLVGAHWLGPTQRRATRQRSQGVVTTGVHCCSRILIILCPLHWWPPKLSEAGCQASGWQGTLCGLNLPWFQVPLGKLGVSLYTDPHTRWARPLVYPSLLSLLNGSKVVHAFPINGRMLQIHKKLTRPSKGRNNQRPTILGMQWIIKRSMARNEAMNYSASNICHALLCWLLMLFLQLQM